MKHSYNENNAFTTFIESCENWLGFLVEQYSFSKSEPRIIPPECWIQYRNNDIELCIIYEYGDYPWIRVSVNGKDNSLDNIIKKKWPEQKLNRRKGPSDVVEKIDFVLKSYSIVLQKHVFELDEIRPGK